MTLKQITLRWLTPPDHRGWIILGFFGLTWRILEAVVANPLLLANASFMQLVGPISGAGGLLLIASFFFGSSKATSEANERTDKVLNARKPHEDHPAPVKVVNQPDEPLPVELEPRP